MNKIDRFYSSVSRETSCDLPTQWGLFQLIGYSETEQQGKEHVALCMGTIKPETPILVRIHSECLTGDAFYSEKCDCGPQLRAAMKMIGQEGTGVIIYLRQEGRGIGLLNKIRAYHLQDNGMDTVEANLALGLPVDARNFNLAKDILKDLKIKNVKLLTNNPNKIKTIEDSEINIVERIPLITEINTNNEGYIKTKKVKLGHLF